jgi:RimK family alpha-L-glutamate ligase
LKVAIIGAGNGWHTQQLQAALAARGHACSSLPIAGMVAQIGTQPLLTSAGSSLDSVDLVLARIIPRGSLEQTIFRMDSLHLLEKRGVQVVNSAKTIEQTVDKLYTSGLIAQAGLLTPRTIVCERSAQAIEAFAALGGDVVLKPVFGSMGLGMVRIQQEDVAYRVFKALELERAVYYLQEFIPHHGRDLRAFILGGRVLAAMERRADGWRTNFARGARCRAVRLTIEQEAICLQAADIVGAEYAGVDLLPAVSGPDYLLEVNGIPGWKGLQETCELDIPAEIVAYLETRQPR